MVNHNVPFLLGSAIYRHTIIVINSLKICLSVLFCICISWIFTFAIVN
uniref:Alternative protein ENTPD1 n=1 Tax=Homo sapiens TaxID=9606 RepID=L8E7N4_HUMAN|nr:alternative protein ENTPD1 [Homo sapiens]